MFGGTYLFRATWTCRHHGAREPHADLRLSVSNMDPLRNQGIFDSLRTSGSSRRNNGAVKTSLSDNVHLNGGVTTRVVDRAGVDLGDRHFDELGIWN